MSRESSETTGSVRCRPYVLFIALCVVPLIACQPSVPEDARVADWFDRDDSTTLGETRTGQPWVDLAGPIGIVGKQAAGGPGYSLSTVETGGGNGTVSVTVVAPGSEFWIVVRGSDAGNHWRFGRWQSGDYQLQQVVGHAIGSPVMVTMNTVSPGAGDQVECRLTASALGCSVNGVPVVSTTDQFNSQASKVGLATWSGDGPAATRFDGLVVLNAALEPEFPEPEPDTTVPAGARVADRFARTDAASLGTSETGQSWTDLTGGFGIASHRAAGGPGYSLSTIDIGAPTGTVQATVVDPGDEHWLVLRASDAGNYWRFGRWQGGNYQLQQIVNHHVGQPVVVPMNTVSAAAGDELVCRLTASAIGCAVNGTSVVSTADPFNSGAHAAGFASWSGSGPAATRFDDLFVTDLVGFSDLGVVVTDIDPAFTGEAVEWSVVVANLGTLPAVDVALSLDVPVDVHDAQASTTTGTCAGSACSLGTLAPGTSATVTVDGIAPSTPGQLTLTASVPAGDSTPDNDTGSETTTIRLRPEPGANVIDDFERTGSTLGLTDTGEEWLSEASPVSTFGGTAGATTASRTFSTIDAGWSFATMDLKVGAVGDRRFWAVFRVDDSENYFRLGPDASGAYRIQKVVGGVVQGLQFLTYRTTITAQDGDEIRIISRPDDGIFVSVNGQHLLDAGDVDLMHETRFGFATISPSARIDRLEVSQVLTTGVVVADTFARPDAPTLGQPETGVDYHWWGNFSVQAGTARYLMGHYGLAVVDSSSEAADPAVTVSQVSDHYALVFRYSEDDTYYRFGRMSGGSSYGVDLIVNGHSQAPATAVEVLATPTPTNGDRLEVRQFTDGRVEGYVNETLVLRFTDTTTNLRSTYNGLSTGGVSAHFANFSVVPE